MKPDAHVHKRGMNPTMFEKLAPSVGVEWILEVEGWPVSDPVSNDKKRVSMRPVDVFVLLRSLWRSILCNLVRHVP